MKKIALMMAALVVSGCAQIEDYRNVVKTPAPAGLSGYWQSQGPQSELVSPQAIASLIVTPQGDTLDCRQWQRTIAEPGKLALLSARYTNVTNKLEIYSVERHDDTLEYAGMILKRVKKPTAQCVVALSKQPFASDDIKAQAQIIINADSPNATPAEIRP